MDREKILVQYGNQILHSESFAIAARQKHHFQTDVASHSINTALFAIFLYNSLGARRDDVDLELLVEAALTHDLGILGRDGKYSSNFECLRKHPKDSVTVIHEKFPEMDPKIYDIVASHMFPFSFTVPKSREAWLVSLADKCASCTDFFQHYDIPEESSAGASIPEESSAGASIPEADFRQGGNTNQENSN